MKKLILLLCFFAMPLLMLAQKGSYFGFQGTFYNTWVINQQKYDYQFLPDFDYEVTTGQSFGLKAGYKFTENLGIQLEGRLTSVGQDYERVDGNLLSTKELSFRYLQFPLLLKFNGGESGNLVRFYGLIGPSFGILTKAEERYNVSIPVFQDIETTENRRDDVTNVDIAATLEFGAEFYLFSGLYLNLGLRLNMSISDINDEQYHDQDNYKPSRNAYGGINAGINYILAR